MKKLILIAASLASMFLAGSCQRENLEPAATGTTVTYTVKVPGAEATKASEYRGVVDKLIYEVYRVDENGNPVKLYQNDETTIVNGEATLNIEVVKDQDVTILFWAQDSDAEYNTNNLTSVQMPATLTANVDLYEAFYGKDEFVFATDITAANTVELTRAVSMLNIGTTAASLKVGGVTNNNVILQESAVTVEGLPNTLNIMTGVASTEVEATYSYSTTDGVTVPSGNFTVGNVDYVYVSKNFVAFADEDKSTADITLEILTDEGTITHEIPSVPFQRNYKTNIVGDLITSKTGYVITLDNTWSTPEEVVNVVNTAAGLQEAIDNAEEGVKTEIKLEGDIDLSDLAGLLGTLSTKAGSDPVSITIPAGKTVTLNLNGFNLSGVDESTSSFGLITNKGDLSIVNDAEGKVSKILLKATNDREWNAYSSVISAQPGSTLTVGTGVEIEHLGGTDMAYGIDVLTNGKGTTVEVVIDGATVKSTYRPVRQFLNGIEATNNLTVKKGSVIKSMNGNKAIWMQDPSANANTGSLVVEEDAELYGNVFLSVTAGSTEWPVSVSVAASALKGESVVETNSNVPVGYSLENKDGVYTVKFHPVAMIGEKGYATLNAAVAAVPDGETITLVADEKFTETNRCDNGGWWDGLAYSGDKSFTIDLGGYTIKQDGSLNDYLMWVKNDGAKANTITLKNGTMDAGTTAYSAFATASSNKQTITVNLENINLINNISNGAVVKARGGSVLNVKAGTVITGMDSYVGIEAVGNNTVVNVYEGAEIYQNGTSSYVGAIIGASYNATLNIYGGKGKSAKCGIIVMSTGATINVSGGEWTANGDGTVASGNQGVIVSQNNRYESGWACKSILNVTGGTFKGGYDCWGMGPGQEPDDAQINIKGGNFNADPAQYVVAGYEKTEYAGIYTVDKPAALKELEAALAKGGNVTLNNDVTLLEPIKVEDKVVVLDLNGKTITAPLFSAFEVKAGGELTVKNGKVVAYESTVRAIGGKAIIESGEYTSTGTALDSPATYRYSLDCREGGELIINGGTFKSNNGMINVGSTVTINGGKFENIVEKSMTRHFAYVSAPLTINDGEFYGKANSSAGGCFFCGAAAGGDIQVKGGKFTSLWTSGSVNKIFEVYFGGTINVTGGMFNTNGGITTFVTENTDEATKAAYPYVAK